MIARLIKDGATIAHLQETGTWESSDQLITSLLNRLCVPERGYLPFGVDAGEVAAKLLSCQVEFMSDIAVEDPNAVY